MKKQFIVFTFILILIFPFKIHCQIGKAQINFKTTEHDFGEIDESQGSVSFEFVFSNDGDLPLVLGGVNPSCGCTTPEWTKEPIVPGKLGSINVKFDPSSRPGPFNKSITVYSNAETKSVDLKIKGYVKGLDKTFNEYKYSIGDLKIQNIHVAFGSVIKGTIQKKTIEVANGSSEIPLAISLKNVPKYITITVAPTLLKPGDKGAIEVEFNSNKLDDWDYVVNRLELLVNNKKLPDNIFTITADIKEDFSKLTTEDLAMAPKIAFTSEKTNFACYGLCPEKVWYYSLSIIAL